MKAKKWLSIITLGCSFISAILAILIGKSSNCIWYDFSMAVFGSALLGFIMSITEYSVTRRTAMEIFWQEAEKALKKLRKIKYFNTDIPLEKILDCFAEEQHNKFVKELGSAADSLSVKAEYTKKDDLISWFEKNVPMSFSEDDDIDAILNSYYESSMASYRRNVQKVIDSCLAAADIDLGSLDNAYGNLDFFVNGNIRNSLVYTQIYSKIREYRNLALAEKYHFQLLNEGKGNFAVCAEKALHICDKIFEVKESSNDIYNSKIVYQTAFDDIDDALEEFRCKIYHKGQEEPVKHIPVCGVQKNIFGDAEDS
ncbi:MAG: hypothetical protein HFE30_07425 [Clostridiales bacterium]|nr:hypothetical protein [Clostridiales bacterium]